MKRLLSDADPARSAVVANCRMNRERELAGSNGYDRELGFHPLEFLRARVNSERIIRWLANLDSANFKLEDGKPLSRSIAKLLREARIEYDSRRKRLVCRGRREVRFPLAFLGADDTAGPNCTGQAAVDSYYRNL